ncbi:MAG: DUF4010 domain-containing protein, partial [Prochlorothrix sp.]|nr:DUF4010 domain-containing protein [Prochlorothrix sp.]
LLMLILVVVRGAEAYFGDAGVYVVAAISGLADVDAVSISLSKRMFGNLRESPLPPLYKGGTTSSSPL